MQNVSWLKDAGITDKDTLFDVARVAEQADRPEDMAYAVRLATEKPVKLTEDERNLFSLGYKNYVVSRRNSWRTLSSIERKVDAEHKKQTEDYRKVVEREIAEVSKEVVDKVKKLLPMEDTAEGKVFFKKMMGDYFRYRAETSSGTEREEAVKSSKDAYEEAMKIAEADLPATCSTRLGLALNYSVFHYEIVNDPNAACELAKQAFNLAIPQLEQADAETSRDSTHVMQLLRDNLSLWTSELQANE